MNKVYLWITRFESVFFSVIVAYGTFNLVGVIFLIAMERIATITSNEFSLVCVAFSMLVIWLFSIFKSFEITTKHLDELFKIDGSEK